MNLLDKQAALLYTAGPLGGAMLAGLLFRVTHPMEFGTVNNPGYSAMVIEFIGTFLLCFTVATAVAGGSDLAPISIGSILMTQVYAGAATSGANYNPAVTFALFAFSILKGSNDMPLSKAFGYVVAQLAGSATAFYTAGLITPTPGFPSSAVPLLWTVGLEAIGTFFLVFTILQVAASSNSGHDFFGLSIGFVVLSMAFTIGGLSGGAFNPAVGLLPVLATPSLPTLVTSLIVYGGGPCGGALVAVLLFRITNDNEFGYVQLKEPVLPTSAKPSPAKKGRK